MAVETRPPPKTLRCNCTQPTYLQDVWLQGNIALAFHASTWCHTNSFCDFHRVTATEGYAYANGGLGGWG